MAQTAKSVDVKKDEKAAPPATRPAEWPLENLRDEIDRLFDGFLGGRRRWTSPLDLWVGYEPFKEFAASQAPLIVQPRTDVAEDDKAYTITAELPGLEEKDVDVTLSDGRLTVSGEKKSERDEKKKDYHLTERRYGSFKRSFRLPDDVNDQKIDASFGNGVLTVTLPKTAKAKPEAKKIAIGKKK